MQNVLLRCGIMLHCKKTGKRGGMRQFGEATLGAFLEQKSLGNSDPPSDGDFRSDEDGNL